VPEVQGGGVRDIDLPYEHDAHAKLLATFGPIDPETIADLYGVNVRTVFRVTDRGLARFRDRWVELYGTEPPDLVRRDWRGMEVA
jgi:hypothetical protein